ncbi:MAG: hypothetical protein A2846_00605 [Candidatus Doudnabacteria bacterium RIFCSPHIGHO2_01_FULL_49_9]|uniref:DEAD/DEAH box helicase n=1 Tax=Candidatus Doudnabacteria bacterium RIFCSPHIGHO2_01_FULL_49_9 TaxID=1817827 RepID=A0A1F5P0I6_9BACT|nr:MAG: hypothetical protein A2846_00605 [Candidatus Doudnabacteria bacterium RIFCSPHIGHO2_01_FULL_49_9]
MASGLGKTVTAALDVKKWLAASEKGSKVLYLCHQNDILEQARQTFETVIGRKETYGYFSGLGKEMNSVTCLFATFQMMRDYTTWFDRKEFSYVVVDETHHLPAPTFWPTVEYFKSDFMLGITATPERTDLKDLSRFYGEPVFVLELEEALARGLLTPVDYRLITDEIQNLEVLDTPVGQVSITELNRKLFVPKRDEEIAAIILKHVAEIPDPRVMIFCPTIRYCEHFARLIPGSVPIHYALPAKSQRLRLESFRKGTSGVVISVDKFNEGIDVPEANLIVFLRSTRSRVIFKQQLGRGLRRHAGKKNVRVLDFVANCERLEMVQQIWEAVQSKKSAEETTTSEPVQIDCGRIQFTEVAVWIIEKLAAIRRGYTKEVLVQYLRDLAEELGRPPEGDDVIEAAKKGKCPSLTTFKETFGSFIIALREARLLLDRKRKLLLQLYRLWKQRARKTLTIKDIQDYGGQKHGRMGSAGHFVNVFGSLEIAIQRFDKYVMLRLQLLEELKTLGKKLGKRPSKRDIDGAGKKGGISSAKRFAWVFGSIIAAQDEAGLIQKSKGGAPRTHTRRKILQQLKTLGKKLGRRPTMQDVREASKRGECPAPSTIQRICGGFDKAISDAGFK